MTTPGDPLFSLQGRRALITGASRGIGRAVAMAYAARGAAVALVARREDALRSTVAEIRAAGGVAEALTGDVKDPEVPERVVGEAADRLGGLDVLVHNAGGSLLDEDGVPVVVPLQETTDEQWAAVLDLNLTASFRLCRAAHRHLRTSDHGCVVLVSSSAAFKAAPGADSYATAKRGQLALAQTLSVAWAGDGIRVNALCPGWTATDLSAMVRGDAELTGEIVTGIAQRRFADPVEMAGPAVFLASDAASYVTGHTLIADGGQTAM